MMGKVAESIFNGESHVIPYADVQYIRKDLRKGYEGNFSVILKGTTWNNEIDTWNNDAYLKGDEASKFFRAWREYRAGIESETLLDIKPDSMFPDTYPALDKLKIR